MTPVSSYVTRLPGPDTWDDFARLVEANNAAERLLKVTAVVRDPGPCVSGTHLSRQAQARSGDREPAR